MKMSIQTSTLTRCALALYCHVHTVEVIPGNAETSAESFSHVEACPLYARNWDPSTDLRQQSFAHHFPMLALPNHMHLVNTLLHAGGARQAGVLLFKRTFSKVSFLDYYFGI